MATCRACGREFESKPETSIPDGFRFLHLVRYDLRVALALIAALFVIGGMAIIGIHVGSAFADHDFSLPTLSLSALFAVVFGISVLILRNWHRSMKLSHCCPDCAERY